MRRALSVLGLAAAFAFGTAALDSWAGPGCGKCGGAGGCGTQCGSASMAEARDAFHALLGDHEQIRAHARAVSEFAERGFARAHEASPLPEGYAAPRFDPAD